jgi:hypothetical protein
MKGYIFVSPGSDPGAGQVLDDPILFGKRPTMGTCRPDLRRLVQKGDYLFVISGSKKGFSQYVIGGFSIDDKINQMLAYDQFPENRLRFEEEQRYGNIIVDRQGQHDVRDGHDKLEKRIQNYLIGDKPVMLATPPEVSLGRERSLPILAEMFERPHARKISEVVGRNRKLNEKQIETLLAALQSLKAEAAHVRQHR